MRLLLRTRAIGTLALSGCKMPVGVRETGFQAAYQASRANVLGAGGVQSSRLDADAA